MDYDAFTFEDFLFERNGELIKLIKNGLSLALMRLDSISSVEWHSECENIKGVKVNGIIIETKMPVQLWNIFFFLMGGGGEMYKWDQAKAVAANPDSHRNAL